MKHTSILRTIFASLIMMFVVSNLSAQGIIRTIAGNGIGGFAGDGGLALTARLNTPSGVAVDAGGNVYIADKYNNRIRMISAASGFINTVAGTSIGYFGMGGPAILSQLEYPNAIFVDNSSNYYFTDWYNDAAFLVDGINHNITNFCGHHTQGYTGDGGDAPLATMQLPDGVWKDNATGDVYLIDGSHHIRKVNGTTNIVTTIAGNGTLIGDGHLLGATSFGGFGGICTDTHGNMFISDWGSNSIRRVDALGNVRTIAGNGTPGYTGDGGNSLLSQLNHPGNMYINNAGYLFICDIGNNAIRVINTNTCVINTVAGNGTAGFSGDMGLAIAAQLNQPTGVWQDASGAIYIADAGNNRIRKVTGAVYKSSPSNTNELANVQFDLYPNPNNGTFTVELNVAPQFATIEVYNMLGIRVYSQNIAQQLATINIQQPAGIYNVVINTGANIVMKKVIIR